MNKLKLNAKKLCYKKLKKSRKNAFQTWGNIKSLPSLHKSTITPDKVKRNAIIHTDLKDIAETFNKYFSRIGNKLASKIAQNDTND